MQRKGGGVTQGRWHNARIIGCLPLAVEMMPSAVSAPAERDSIGGYSAANEECEGGLSVLHSAEVGREEEN